MLVAMTHVADGDWSAAVEALDLALAHRRAGGRPRRAVEPRQRRPAAGRRRRPAALLRATRSSRAREAGAVTAVVYCLQRLCFGHFLAGDLVAVRSSAEEALALGREHRPAGADRPADRLADAARGAPGPRRLRRPPAPASTRSSTAHPLGILTDPVHDLTRWAKGAPRRRGRATASAPCTTSAGSGCPSSRGWPPPSASTQPSAPARPDLARAWVDELAGLRRGHRTAVGARHGRLRAGDDGRPGRGRGAVPGGAGPARAAPVARCDAARTQLAYGEWLRRTQRRVDARQHLRQALETFQDLRAEALAARANQELRASGETARKRDPSTLVKLTPMELKIAQLVSSGLSNKDVAAQCWISPRTVAFHLRNVFAKAGVTSRGELAQLDLA